MKQLNDSLIMIMKPAMPFLEWMVSLSAILKNKPAEDQIDIETLSYITAVLIQKKPDLDRFNEFLMEHCDALLQHEFSRWTSHQDYWPLRNDVEILLEYFQLELYQNVVDLREDTLNYYSIAILRPTSELKNWLKEILKLAGKNISLLEKSDTDPFQAVSTAYLLPGSVKSVDQAVLWIRDQYAKLFLYELNRYITDKKYWPENHDLEQFWLWFEMDYYPKSYVL